MSNVNSEVWGEYCHKLGHKHALMNRDYQYCRACGCRNPNYLGTIARAESVTARLQVPQHSSERTMSPAISDTPSSTSTDSSIYRSGSEASLTGHRSFISNVPAVAEGHRQAGFQRYQSVVSHAGSRSVSTRAPPAASKTTLLSSARSSRDPTYKLEIQVYKQELKLTERGNTTIWDYQEPEPYMDWMDAAQDFEYQPPLLSWCLERAPGLSSAAITQIPKYLEHSFISGWNGDSNAPTKLTPAALNKRSLEDLIQLFERKGKKSNDHYRLKINILVATSIKTKQIFTKESPSHSYRDVSTSTKGGPGRITTASPVPLIKQELAWTSRTYNPQQAPEHIDLTEEQSETFAQQGTKQAASYDSDEDLVSPAKLARFETAPVEGVRQSIEAGGTQEATLVVMNNTNTGVKGKRRRMVVGSSDRELRARSNKGDEDS